MSLRDKFLGQKQKLENFKAECRYETEMEAQDDDPGA